MNCFILKNNELANEVFRASCGRSGRAQVATCEKVFVTFEKPTQQRGEVNKIHVSPACSCIGYETAVCGKASRLWGAAKVIVRLSVSPVTARRICSLRTCKHGTARRVSLQFSAQLYLKFVYVFRLRSKTCRRSSVLAPKKKKKNRR